MSTLSQFTSGIKSIQRGTIQINSGQSGSAAISSVNTAKAHLAYLGALTISTNLTTLGRITLASSTSVSAFLGGNTTGTVISFEVIEFY